MLRGNLSSRPFYNEGMVSSAIAFVAILAVALSAFNVYKVYALSRQRSALKAAIGRDMAQADGIERAAQAVQRNVSRTALAELAGSTQEANTLIDQRTFSWTVFFGVIEKILPMDLHLVRVEPRIEKGNIRVTMNVVARKTEDIDAFVDALQDTGSFYDLLPHNIERNDEDNTFRADVVGYYLTPNQAQPPKRPARPSKALGKGRP